MKIADFNNVKIGDKVFLKETEYTIKDINRRTHEANLGLHKWIRCSELDLERTTKREKRVRMIFSDGSYKEFHTLKEAAQTVGLNPSSICRACAQGYLESKVIVQFRYAESKE